MYFQNSDKIKISVQKLSHALHDLPKIHTEDSIGWDLAAANFEDIIIVSGETKKIPTGLCFEIPSNFYMDLRSRSSIFNLGLLIHCALVDADYRGEVFLLAHNFSKNNCVIKRGMRLAQFFIAPKIKIELVNTNSVSETLRSSGGLGSTGIF